MRCVLYGMMLAAAALPCRIAAAEDANVAFNSLFGEDVKKVLATQDTRDDVELAGQLLAAAKKLPAAQAEMLTVLCEKVHELAARPTAGRPLAVEAMGLLMDKVPARQAAWRQKIIAVYVSDLSTKSGAERQAVGETLIDLYMEAAEERAEAGDHAAAADQARKALIIAETIRSPLKEEVQARATELGLRERLERQVEELKARLAADANNAQVREEIVRKLLVDLDRPADAAKFVDAGIADQSLRTYVPLAAQGPAELAEAVCMELGDWYRSLGDKAPYASKDDMYQRAKSFYQAFLDKHPAEDLLRTKAKLALENIAALLWKLSASGEGKSWLDLLRLVDLSKHVAGGRWERRDQKLQASGWVPSRATMPVIPDGSYVMLVQFTRTDGNGPVAVLLPVGQTWCALVLGGRRGPSGGLHSVRGETYRDPNREALGPIQSGKEYTLEARVVIRNKTATITADLNGMRYLRWQGPESMLGASLPGDVLGPRALGLFTVDSVVVFASAHLRILSGGAAAVQVDSNPDVRFGVPGRPWLPGRRGWRRF